MRLTLLCTAWKRLMLAYVLAYAASLLIGVLLLNVGDVAPETIFEVSTKRLAYALPVMDLGAEAGLDGGVLLFIWNAMGALVTISFIYTAALFNPLNVKRRPQAMRKIFCSRTRMKLLCFLPNCLKIEAESLRRLYVWLMVPLIGMILLGVETGLSTSTARSVFGSYLAGIISLLPHGIIEIPAIALAGAVAFSAHLLIKPKVPGKRVDEVFQDLDAYKDSLPIKKITLFVVFCLLIAGLVEAHLTPAMVERLVTAA
jgi:uncharacterized membrane protein SpoIIM required for sporulation